MEKCSSCQSQQLEELFPFEQSQPQLLRTEINKCRGGSQHIRVTDIFVLSETDLGLLTRQSIEATSLHTCKPLPQRRDDTPPGMEDGSFRCEPQHGHNQGDLMDVDEGKVEAVSLS